MRPSFVRREIFVAIAVAPLSLVLTRRLQSNTIINAGATGVGIGAVYALAKAAGFQTAGLVGRRV